jgi:hypothetical protein
MRVRKTIDTQIRKALDVGIKCVGMAHEVADGLVPD